MKEKLESDEPSSEPRDQKVTQSRLWLRQRHLRAKEEEKCMMVRMAHDVDFQRQLPPWEPQRHSTHQIRQVSLLGGAGGRLASEAKRDQQNQHQKIREQ